MHLTELFSEHFYWVKAIVFSERSNSDYLLYLNDTKSVFHLIPLISSAASENLFWLISHLGLSGRNG